MTADTKSQTAGPNTSKFEEYKSYKEYHFLDEQVP